MDIPTVKKQLQRIINCRIGKNTKVWNFVNLYGCRIGSDCLIGTFVEIQQGVTIGDRVRIQSHTFICEGVTIKDDVFVGHHVVFINDKYPRSNSSATRSWKLLSTRILKGASIGSNVTILGGITIGQGALVGAGSVVTKNVAKDAIVVGNPARVIGAVQGQNSMRTRRVLSRGSPRRR